VSRPQVRVGGAWLTDLDPAWGALRVTWRWGLGSFEATWSMALQPGNRPAALVAGAVVEILMGGWCIWRGTLEEPNWAEGDFVATGIARQAEGAYALDGTEKTTTVPDTAISAAISRGMVDWTGGTVSAVAHVDTADGETDDLNSLSALLDSVADAAGKRWWVDSQSARVAMSADPSAPSFYVLPGAAELGVSTELLAGSLLGRYEDAVGNLQTARVGTRRPEVAVDLTILGPIDAARATSVLNGILAKTGGRPGWTNGYTITAEQITTPGDVHPDLALVGEAVGRGSMHRLLGERDPRSSDWSTDVVLAEAVWDVDDETITCKPVDTAARDLASIFEEAGVQAG